MCIVYIYTYVKNGNMHRTVLLATKNMYVIGLQAELTTDFMEYHSWEYHTAIVFQLWLFGKYCLENEKRSEPVTKKKHIDSVYCHWYKSSFDKHVSDTTNMIDSQ